MAQATGRKPRRLDDLKVDEVSFVDSPANERPFLILKRKGDAVTDETVDTVEEDVVEEEPVEKDITDFADACMTAKEALDAVADHIAERTEKIAKARHRRGSSKPVEMGSIVQKNEWDAAASLFEAIEKMTGYPYPGPFRRRPYPGPYPGMNGGVEMAKKSKLGDAIKAAREKKEMSQEDLGKASGVSGSMIQQIEDGATVRPPNSRLARIARALGVSASHLIEQLPAGERAEKFVPKEDFEDFCAATTGALAAIAGVSGTGKEDENPGAKPEKEGA